MGSEWPTDWFIKGPPGDGEHTLHTSTEEEVAVAERELAVLLEIQEQATKSVDMERSAAAWNLDVYGPLLKPACASCPGVERVLITTAGIMSRWLPPTRYNQPFASALSGSSVASSGNGSAATGRGMVDFALVLRPEPALERNITECIYTQSQPDWSVNHSRYGELVFNPLGVSIETKIHEGPGHSLTHLGVWTAAWFQRAQNWVDLYHPECSRSDFGMLGAVPVVSVFRHSWNLYFVCDRGASFGFLGPVSMGTTQDLVGLYKLLAVLRELVRWVDVDFRAWCTQLFSAPA